MATHDNANKKKINRMSFHPFFIKPKERGLVYMVVKHYTNYIRLELVVFAFL